MQGRELTPQPRPGIVLVGDGVHTEARDQRVELRRRPSRARVHQRLRQRVGAAPCVTQSGRVSRRSAAATKRCAGRGLVFAHRSHAVAGLPGHDHARTLRPETRGCCSRFGCTCAYASSSVQDPSGRTPFFSHVDVVATKPSMSKWLAYTSNRTRTSGGPARWRCRSSRPLVAFRHTGRSAPRAGSRRAPAREASDRPGTQ